MTKRENKRMTHNSINHKVMTAYTHVPRSIRTAARVMALTVMMIWSMIPTTGSAQCTSSALVCNNLVRVSLDTACTALITPDVVLKGVPAADTALYRVELRDPSGNVISNRLTDDYDSQRLEVRVYCRENNLYCWGNIIVEDKIKPIITVTPLDTAVTCTAMPFELDPLSLVTSVTFTDNGCVKPDTFSITDFQETIFPCQDTVKIIRRVFSTVDAAGNQCDTTQTIYLLRAKFSDIIYPRDTLIDCIDEADLSVAKLGQPEYGVCDHFEMNQQDVEIPTCGVARKILRRWTITDICSNRDTVVTQVIKIEDLSAPTFDFSNFTIPMEKVVTDKFQCNADVIGINNPVITDCNIAQTTLTIFYQFTDASGALTGALVPATVNSLLTDPSSDMVASAIWDLKDIPVGNDFRVIFVADDGCGNIARDTSAVFNLPDTAAPNAVCEGNTTVVLNANGETEVPAAAFDDNSFDNCGIDRMEVRRFESTCPGFNSDTSFGPSVTFCCSDIANNPVRVVLRVYDAAGGFSDCIVNAYVQDKREVAITCGGDYQYDCDVDPEIIRTELKNDVPNVTWVCGEESLEIDIPEWTVSECGSATFNVAWTAIDLNGTVATCTQEVFIGNLTPTQPTRPRLNITLDNCSAGTEPDDIPNSRPIINSVSCEKINVSWEDTPSTGTGNSCMVINRKWVIIDWCQFDGGNISSAIIDEFTQVITIRDNVKPTIANCDDLTINDADATCDELFSFTIQATDDCTNTDELTYAYTIDVDSDGDINLTGAESTISEVLPVGVHVVEWTVSDMCGNPETCSMIVTVTTDKAPIPICLGIVGADLGSDRMATIQAATLNQKSTTGCSLSEDGLLFSFDPEGTQTEITVSCSDISSNGIFDEVSVDLYVTDTANGQTSSCNVIIAVSDRDEDVCPDVTTASQIAGVITDQAFKGVESIAVQATNVLTGEVTSSMTDEEGNYAFNVNMDGTSYEVVPQLDDNPLYGITTLDLIVMQRHILGLQKMTNPYNIIAADVNRSNSVTALDMVGIRRLLLGHTDLLPDDNWRFVDRDVVFDDVQYPWNYVSSIMIDDAADMGDNDFIALKVGDVTGDAFTARAEAAAAGIRSTSTMNVTTTRRGDVIRYSFSFSQAMDLAGLQMAIAMTPDTEVKAIGSDMLSLNDEHFRVSDAGVQISWSDAYSKYVDGEEIFFIDVATSSLATPELSLSTDGLAAQVYTKDLEASSIVLAQRDLVATSALRLLQNQPNPFTGETVITFELPESGLAELTVSDTKGQLIYRKNNNYNKGINTIRLDAEDLGMAGIYYYTITTGQSQQTKRMVVLQ